MLVYFLLDLIFFVSREVRVFPIKKCISTINANTCSNQLCKQRYYRVKGCMFLM